MNKKRHYSKTALEMTPPERETIWQTLSRITMTLMVVVGLGVALTFFIPELDRQKALDRDILQLEEQRQLALDHRDSLRRELRWLNDDRDYLEIKARDRLDLFKEGETIIRIDRRMDGDATEEGSLQ